MWIEGVSRRSEIGLGVLLLVALGLATHPPALRGQTPVEGEYALRVTVGAGELGVGWLTVSARPGVVEVFSGGRAIDRTETPASGAHFASFPRPEADAVVLRYGTLGDDLHMSTVYLREDRPPETGVLPAVDSLFVVGDVHGEYDRLLRLLRNAELVDAAGRWVGGRSHVAFLGDIFDRGPDVTRTLWFLYRLEREASAAGGGAHVVLGNHETMIFTRDLRYVSEKERLIARLHGVDYSELFDIRGSVLGRWLAGRPAVMRIGDVLLTHGGVAPGSERQAIEAINDSVRAFMAEDFFYRWGDPTVALVTNPALAEPLSDQYAEVIVMDSASVARRYDLVFAEESPLWYRGYVESDTLAPALQRVLRDFEAELHVVGHTPVESIESRYGGELIAVDLLEPATEMLLLTTDPETSGYDRWRIRLDGTSEALQ